MSGYGAAPTYAPGDHEIELASGHYLDLANPDSAAITLRDIAHGLANTCRYAGQTARFYSVAEHAVLVASRLRLNKQPPAVQLAGLHHDDAEAFIADIARPLKSLLQPAYDQITNRIDAAIWEALDLPLGYGEFAWAEVKAADNWALAAEAYYLMPSRGQGWWSEGLYNPYEKPQPTAPRGYAPGDARAEWLHWHRMLSDEHANTPASAGSQGRDA